YTKRQYAAYYHINETLAHGDEPQVTGKTGLRPWQDRASDYCYKVRALRALTDLITNTPARRILLSYSAEGHVALDDLTIAIAAALARTPIHPSLALTSLARAPMAVAERRKAGAYYTDFRLAQFLASGCLRQYVPGAKVIDAASGTGILLVAAALAVCSNQA